MKSISTIVTLLLLAGTCRICSLTDPKSTTTPSPTPIAVSSARDFIKDELGNLKITKRYNKEEARKTASGFTVKLIEESNDAAGGEYKFSNGHTAALMATSYATTTQAASLIDEIEKGLRADPVWKSVKASSKDTGKKVEAQDGRGNGLVLWQNGLWIFLTIGESPADASMLADSVGF